MVRLIGRLRRLRNPPGTYECFLSVVADELFPKSLKFVRTARPTPEDPYQREALESAVAAEARQRERIDAEIARREADGTLEADLKRYEAEASKADPLWGRKPAALRREVALAGMRAEIRTAAETLRQTGI